MKTDIRPKVWDPRRCCLELFGLSYFSKGGKTCFGFFFFLFDLRDVLFAYCFCLDENSRLYICVDVLQHNARVGFNIIFFSLLVGEKLSTASPYLNSLDPVARCIAAAKS